MLLHVPKCFTPDLMSLLMRMGHGEALLICDANFPYSTVCRAAKAPVYITGFTVEQILREILYYFPLDYAVKSAAVVMDSAKESELFRRYREILSRAVQPTELAAVSRMDFYDKAKAAAGVVVTSDTAKGGNIMIQKGVVREPE